MGTKKADVKKILDTIDGTIRKLEQRMRELQGEADPATGKYPARVENELSWLTQNLSRVKTARKEIQETLERTKTEEEKKRVMNGVALAMLVGAINENMRLAEERARREAFASPAERLFDAVAEALFSSEDFRFVTEEDVESILEDQELQEMAESDPNRLEREEKDFKAEYEAMITLAIGQAGIAEGENFQENEKRFREFLKRNNGFEATLKRNAKFLREKIIDNIEGNVPEEDRKFFSEVRTEIDSLGKITRKLQERYILEEDSFEKGNGYTDELIERENKLVDKIRQYSESKLKQIMDLGPDVEKVNVMANLYKHSQMMYTPVAEQRDRDKVLHRNNDLRRRLERWSVYQQLPGEDRPEILKENVLIKNRKAAAAKLRRMERAAVRSNMESDEELSELELKERAEALRQGHGGIRAMTSAMAVAETETLLERLESDEPLKKNELPMVRKALAALVLHQLIVNDMKRPEGDPKYYYEAMQEDLSLEGFKEMTGDLAETDEFIKAVDPLIKGKNIRENVYRFLANDFERDASKKVYAGVRARIEKAEKKEAEEKLKKEKKKKKSAGKEKTADEKGKTPEKSNEKSNEKINEKSGKGRK